MRSAWVIVLGAGLATASGACDRGAPAPASEHGDHAHHHGAANEAPAPTPAPAGPRIETGSFMLAMAPAQPSYRTGKTGQLMIALESRGPWHVNQEYPIRLDLTADPSLTLPKKELVRDDAKAFGEEKVLFVAAVQPTAAGAHDVSCDVSFAMCTDENCVIERRKVTAKLDVE